MMLLSRSRLILPLLAVLWLVAGCKAAPTGDVATATPPAGAVAVVDGEPVTEAQWQQGRAYAEATLRLLGEPEAALDEGKALESYLEDLFIAAEAEAAGFSIDDAQVVSEEQRLLQVAGTDEAGLRAVLAQVGLSYAGWRRELDRAVLAAEYLDQVVLAGVAPGERAAARRRWLQARKEALGLRLLAQFQPVEGLQVGDLAPDFEVAGLDGASVRLGDLRGRAVVLNFWATWCFPCREEMPLLQEAYDELREEGLTILAVDVGEDTASVQQFVDDLGIRFPVALDRSQELSRRYRVFGLPTSFFIDRRGVIDYVVAGAVRQDDLRTYLREIMAETPAP